MGLGTQLVGRSTRRVFLTIQGEQLLPRALAVVEAVEAFTAAAQGHPIRCRPARASD
jgi:LysR family transcriptional regulator, hydrogen peroxide-inducible genes activator